MQKKWDSTVPMEERVRIWRKAADLMSGPYRAQLNAATMLGQGKTAIQADIDAAAELIDFFRLVDSHHICFRQRGHPLYRALINEA